MNVYINNTVYLESPDSIHHPLELYPLDILVLPVHPLHPEDVIAEVETLEPPLLRQEDNHDTTCPIEAFSKQLLHCKLIFTN